MKTDFSHEVHERSVLEVSQQYLAGPEVSPDVEFKLGRACVAHCFAAAQELVGGAVSNSGNLTDFVLENGAGMDSGLYRDGRGWNILALANLLRLKGHMVVAQDLRYGTGGDFQTAFRAGWAATESEKGRFVHYSSSGGHDKSRWLNPIDSTIQFGGVAVTSIQIPLLSGDGYGDHAVAVTGVNTEQGYIDYFDPDYYNASRYGGSAPAIERLDETRLMYRRPAEDHLAIMSGKVTHIFPCSN